MNKGSAAFLILLVFLSAVPRASATHPGLSVISEGPAAPRLDASKDYVYDTAFGRYVFPRRAPHTLEFRVGAETLLSSSMFGLAGLDGKAVDSRVAFSNDTLFVAEYTLVDGKGKGEAPAARMRLSVRFFYDAAPKITAEVLSLLPAWKRGEPQVVWVLEPSTKHLRVGDGELDTEALTVKHRVRDAERAEDKVAVLSASEVFGGAMLRVDWGDAAGRTELYAERGVLTVAFPVGARVIDPSVVGTSTTDFANMFPSQRNTFYAEGRHWVFYSDGVNMVYRTSTDAAAWTAATVVRAAARGTYFSVAYDGTYVHYAYCLDSSIKYRRGDPQPNGAIVWSTGELNVATTYNAARFPYITTDASKRPVITYKDQNGGLWYPYAVASSYADGTWSTVATYPRLLNAAAAASWRVWAAPTSAGVVYVYASDGGTIRATRRYQGAWYVEVDSGSTVGSSDYISVSGYVEGATVRVAYLESVTNDIKYRPFDIMDNSWGAESTVYAAASATSSPVITANQVTGEETCFWAGDPAADTIYYSTLAGGAWSVPAVLVASADALTGNDRLSASMENYGGYSGVNYMTLAASPFNVCYQPLVIDDIQITSLTASCTEPTVGDSVRLEAQAELAGLGHALGAGDTFTVSGAAFAWDASVSRFVASVTSAAPGPVTYDAFDSGLEATYAVTTGAMNGFSVTLNWVEAEPAGSPGDGGGGGGGGGGGVSPAPVLPPLPIAPGPVADLVNPFWQQYGASLLVIIFASPFLFRPAEDAWNDAWSRVLKPRRSDRKLRKVRG